ncbi:MAG: hypothetical protein KatS3mg129_1489 [Leptospiraceae bacterium]|nr:MAG: hypothetical protein KatS3mg129_1489 [Leptospiraceae bacterium]
MQNIEKSTDIQTRDYFEEDEIDLIELFYTLLQEKIVIIGVTILVFLISLVITLITPKTYKAEVLVEIRENPINNKIMISFSEIQEAIDLYKKSHDPLLKIQLTQLRGTEDKIKIEVEDSSPEEAKNTLKKIISLINSELFQEKYKDITKIIEYTDLKI